MGNENFSFHKDISCGLFVAPLIKYLKKKIGNEKIVREEVNKLGLSIEFLLNKKNFVSYEYFCAFLDLVEKLTHSKNFISEFFEHERRRFLLKFSIYYIFLIFNLFSKEKILEFLLNKLICRFYLKVGSFNIIKERSKVKIEFFLLNEKINITFWIFLISFLSFIGNLFYFQLNVKEKEKGIFEIKFLDFFLIIKRSIYLIFIGIIIFEISYFIFIKFFPLSQILLTILFFCLLNLLMNYQLYKFNFFYSSNLSFNFLIEESHKELIKKEKEITEKNLYLTILNEIRRLIYDALYFTPLLLNVAKIFLEKLNFLKAIYFEFNDKKKSYEYLFELNNSLINNEKVRTISFSNIILLEDFREELLKRDVVISSNVITEYIVDYNSKFNFQFFKNKSFYYLLIEIKNLYSGFFLFYKDEEIKTNKEIIEILFNEIADLLKISYQNILNSHTVENILSSIPSYVVIFDINKFLIKFVNELFLTSFPFINKNEIKKKVIDKDLFSVIPFNNEDINNIKNYITYEINNYRSKRFETIIGNYFFEYHLFRIPNFKGKERFLGIIINDITEAKYFWRNIIVNEKLIALGRVASGIAHEINNPLYAVLANAEEIAENKTLDEHIRKCADEIVNQVINVSNIIKDLSAFSKTLRKEEINFVDINNVIEESLKLVKYSSNYLEVEIFKELSPDLPFIKATKGEIQQIFINIFTNAIQAMNGRGKLFVRSIFNRNKIKITISDTGIGINKKDLPYIFDLYFSTKKEGSGLGLHIVKRIVEKYNGKIYVKSKLGEGTTFDIYFNIFKKEHKDG